MIHSIAAAAVPLGVALFAPNAYPWELAWCVVLAATLPAAEAFVIVRSAPASAVLQVSDAQGNAIDWSLAPAFAAVRWAEPA